MKKSLIIALGAIALVACTKTSVSYEQTGEIGFAPVVRKNSTKAAVQGATFPEQNIMVFGYYDNSMPVGSPYDSVKFGVEYLPGVEFAKNGDIWAGANNKHYYWPKTGSMLFAGYSPVDFAGVTFSLAGNKFSVDTLVQPEFSATNKDLLYAGYGTSVLSGPVAMAFSHALSWVTVKAKAAAANQIKITNIKFVKLAEKGSSTGLPEWTTTGTKDITVFNPEAASEVPEEVTLVESHENCGLVFPQELTNAEIVISYEMNNGADQWFAQAPFVKKLNSLKSGTDTINKWEAGKHYTYIINFSTIEGGPDSSNEITIKPSITDWTPVDVNGVSAN